MTRVGEVNELERIMDKLYQKKSYFEWQIRKFRSLSSLFFSPSFSFARASWRLEMFLYSGNTNLHLKRESSGSSINLEFSLGLKTKDGRRDSGEYYTSVFNEAKRIYEIEKVYSKSRLLDSYVGDSGILTVYCTMRELFPKSPEDTERCFLCKTTLKADEEISSHLQKCMDKPLECAEGGSAIILNDLNGHVCPVATAEDLSARKEGKVEKEIPFQKQCVDKTVKSAECDNTVNLEDLNGNACGVATADGYTQTETEMCVFCKANLEAGEEISSYHQKCMDKRVKCAECSEVVILKDLNDHQCQVATLATEEVILAA